MSNPARVARIKAAFTPQTPSSSGTHARFAAEDFRFDEYGDSGCDCKPSAATPEVDSLIAEGFSVAVDGLLYLAEHGLTEEIQLAAQKELLNTHRRYSNLY